MLSANQNYGIDLKFLSMPINARELITTLRGVRRHGEEFQFNSKILIGIEHRSGNADHRWGESWHMLFGIIRMIIELSHTD